MRKRVYLHGSLATDTIKFVDVVASTVAEAIELVSRQLKTFKPDPINGPRRVMVQGVEKEADLYNKHQGEEIHLAPALLFGKKRGLTQIIIGTALIVVGFLVAPYSPEWGAAITMYGIGMVIGGVIQMFSPQPRLGNSGDEKRSRYLGPAQNTVRIGTTIPLLYGRRRVGGHYLSVNVNAKSFR